MKIKYITEGVFKNPTQARAEREKSAQRSNAEKLTGIVSDTIIIPAVKKFLIESSQIRVQFSKIALRYIDGNDGNTSDVSKIVHPYSSTTDWAFVVGNSMFCEPFQADKVRFANSSSQSRFTITDVQIVDKNIDKGVITVDLNAVISYPGYSGSMYLYNYIMIGSSGIFKGKPGSENQIRTDLSKELTSSYKQAIKICKEGAFLSEDEINVLSHIKTIAINKIYMYRNVPTSISSIGTPGAKELQQDIEYAGKGMPRNKRDNRLIGFLVFPSTSRVDNEYSTTPIKPGSFEISDIDEDIVMKSYGGVLDVFDFTKSDLRFFINAFVNGVYNVPAAKTIKYYVENVVKCCSKEYSVDLQRYDKQKIEPAAKLFSGETLPSLICTYVAKKQYEFRNNKLVPSEYHKNVSKILAAASSNDYETLIKNDEACRNISTSYVIETGYNDIYVALHRVFITSQENPSMADLSTQPAYYSPQTESFFPIFPTEDNVDMLSIYNRYGFEDFIASSRLINRYMPFFSTSYSFNFDINSYSKEMKNAELSCRGALFTAVKDGFYKMFDAISK